jgi:Phosphotransferase enzyme family
MNAVTTDVRGDPAAVDGPWLTAALEAAGIARGATVTSVVLDGFIGTGQTGRNARFLLEWDDPAGGAAGGAVGGAVGRAVGGAVGGDDRRPASVVGKFSSADALASRAAFENGTYRNEWAFYTDLAHTLDVRAPACHVALYDEHKPDFVLIMEDLAGSRQGDQFAGLTLDQAALAVEQAVGLHAPRWGDPTLADFHPERTKGIDRAAMLGALYEMTMEPFLDRLGPRLDADVVDLVRQLQPKVAQWVLASDTPMTVVHLDFRPDNFMFGTTPGAPPLVVVDWQTVGRGTAMWDLAYVIGGSFERDMRCASERDLLDEYRRRMAAAGVDYAADACWRDYRLGALWGLAMTVIATILAAETERGNDMLTTMGQRHGRHAIDLESLSLLG